MIDAKDLAARRGGAIAFMWYRATFTMPAMIGDFDLSKPSQAVLDVLVDDYAEVWINGQIPRRTGYPSPATMQGHNMPNRVVLGTEVKAGDKFQVASSASMGRSRSRRRTPLVPPRHGGFLPVSVAG